MGTVAALPKRARSLKTAGAHQSAETQITLTLRRIEFNRIRRVSRFLRCTPEEVLTALVTNENFEEYTNNCLHLTWIMDRLNALCP